MDAIGWYIATMHQLLGHDQAAAALGVPPGDRSVCVLCAYEAGPTPERRAAVLAALAKPPG
jgi:hypothetical protein